MTTPVNCPNCGSQLPPGAPVCARCGQRFDIEPEPAPPTSVSQPAPPPKPASATPSPRLTGATGTGPAASGDVGKAVQQYVKEARERWGFEQTPIFTACMVVAIAAFLVGTVALIILLTAGENDTDKHLDYATWLTTADALAFGALVLGVLVRYDAPRTPAVPDTKGIDFQVFLAVAGLAILFGLIGAITGMGGHEENGVGWTRYSTLFSFLAATWLILAQPVPEMLGTTKSTTIGLVLAGVALVILLLGTFQGLSNSYDTYIGGLSWQQVAISLIALDLGWFLGMQPRR
jgi:hypothetical protein